MKKNKILFVIFLLSSVAARSQLYVKPYSGYVFSTNPVKVQSIEIINNVENIYATKYKMGQGINAGLSLGYKFTKNLSFEITANSQIFPAQKNYIPQKGISDTVSFYISGKFGKTRYTNSIWQLAPQFVYTIDYNKNILCFIKAGPNFLKVKTTFENSSMQLNLDTTGWHFHQIESANIEKGNIRIGIQSSAGVEYKLSKNIHCVFEFISVINQFEYNSDETIKNKIDGADHLNDINPRQQKIENVIKTNFGQCGFNIGIKYLL
jgi:opacity protein-like surface antigen